MRTALRVLRPYLRPYRRALAIGMLAMVGEIGTALLAPVPVQRVVDRIIRPIRGKVRLERHVRHGDVPLLLGLGALVVAIALLDAAFTYLDLRQTARVGQRSVTDLRRALFGHLQRLSLSFHQDRDTRLGELQLRLGSDVQALQDLVGSSLSNAVTNGGTALLMLSLLFVVQPWIGLLVLAASVPVYVLARHYRRRSKEVSRQARRQEGRVSAMLAETLSAAKLVQGFGQEGREERRLHQETEVGLDYGLRATEYEARVQPLVALTTSVATALVLVLGAVLTVNRVITVGVLTLVLAYTRGTFGSLRQLAKLSTQTQKATVGAERVMELLSRAPAVADPVRPKHLNGGPLDIRFSNVSFGYSERQPVLHGVDLEIPAGATVALVGPTGAGKSTLLSLVPRFYDVWEGSVQVGGLDVRDLSLGDLRAHVTLVLQESLLFRESLRNNIAYGRPGATDEEIMAAAEAAGVTAFVDELEDGFESVVSERGTSLSGGQKQCVAIARALLRDTPIVIMDEPTSSLDSITERLVISGIEELMRGRTAVVIAHRFSTIRHVDLVAVIDEGRLVETGPPQRLLAQDGLYSELSRLQQLTTTADRDGGTRP